MQLREAAKRPSLRFRVTVSNIRVKSWSSLITCVLAHRGDGEAWMAGCMCLVHPQHPWLLHNWSSAKFPLFALVCRLCGAGGWREHWKLGPSTPGGSEHVFKLCTVWTVPSSGGDCATCYQCHLSKSRRQPVRISLVTPCLFCQACFLNKSFKPIPRVLKVELCNFPSTM